MMYTVKQLVERIKNGLKGVNSTDPVYYAKRALQTKEDIFNLFTRIGQDSEKVEKIIINGDGTKYLSNDGSYKVVVGGGGSGSASGDVDGGAPDSIYLPIQKIDGGLEV